MGYRTPNIDRIAKEGMLLHRLLRRAELHRRPRRRSSPASASFRTGLTKVGLPGRRRRAAGRGPDDRRAAQAARLRHRPVRQEPPRRPQRVPADGPRLRRVLRQPLPPQRRGGARELPTTRRTRSSAKKFGPRGVLTAGHRRDDRRRPALRHGRQAEDRGHRPADQEADGDHRRRDRRDAAVDFIKRQHEADKPFFVLVQLHPHALPHPPQAGEHRPGRTLAVAIPRHDDRPRQERRRRCSTRSTSSASPTTRSSCTRPTTART